MESQNTPLPINEPTAISQVSDEDLFLDYRDRGNQAAFDALVHRYDRELFGYLRRYLRREDLAEEVFQSTFIQLHRKQDQFEEGRRFRPWLYSVATHLAVDLLRQRGRQHAVSLDRPALQSSTDSVGRPTEIASPAPGPLAQLEAAEQRAWVRSAVEDLPEHLRSTVMLAYFQGLKYEEIAETLGVPLGTVKSRINAAMKRLAAGRETAEAAARGKSPRHVRSGRSARRSAQSTNCGFPMRAGIRQAAGESPPERRSRSATAKLPLREVLGECERDFSDVRLPVDLADGTCQKLRQSAADRGQATSLAAAGAKSPKSAPPARTNTPRAT